MKFQSKFHINDKNEIGEIFWLSTILAKNTCIYIWQKFGQSAISMESFFFSYFFVWSHIECCPSECQLKRATFLNHPDRYTHFEWTKKNFFTALIITRSKMNERKREKKECRLRKVIRQSVSTTLSWIFCCFFWIGSSFLFSLFAFSHLVLTRKPEVMTKLTNTFTYTHSHTLLHTK